MQKMGEHLDNLTEFVCDRCYHKHKQQAQEELEKECEQCALKDHITKVWDKHKNELKESEEKCSNLVKCDSCVHRKQGKGYYWCRNPQGLGGHLSKHDACSRGAKRR